MTTTDELARTNRLLTDVQIRLGELERQVRTEQRDSIAGLQRLVESLVNERDEGRKSTMATCRDEYCRGVETSRIAMSDELTKAGVKVGIEGRVRVRMLAEERDQLRAEVERLTRERDEASKTRDAFEVERAGLRQLVADMCQWFRVADDIDANLADRLTAREGLRSIANATKENGNGK